MKRAAFAVVVLVLFLGLVEGLGRLLYDEPRPTHTFEDDPDLGWILPANAHFDFAGESVQTNSWRMRGAEPRDASKTLIALGDSSVFGHGVGGDETFSALLDARLDDAQVLNGGVPGYTCWQALGTAERVPVPLDGAVIYPGVSDSFVLDRKDQVVLPAGLDPLRGTGLGRLLLELAAKRTLGSTRTSPEDFERCLGELVDVVGPAVMVVPIAQGDLWGSRSWSDAPVAHLLPYREAMQRVAEAHGLPLVDIPAVVQALGDEAEGVLLDPVHPSVLGHAIIAAEAEAAIRDAGMLQ